MVGLGRRFYVLFVGICLFYIYVDFSWVLGILVCFLCWRFCVLGFWVFFVNGGRIVVNREFYLGFRWL